MAVSLESLKTGVRESPLIAGQCSSWPAVIWRHTLGVGRSAVNSQAGMSLADPLLM
jgi:hypothetical protein